MVDHQLTISVTPGDWGDAIIENIRVLLEATARELITHLPDIPMHTVVVIKTDDCPIAINNIPVAGTRFIGLNVRGRDWCKFIYQFSHELCHHLCNAERYFPTVEERWFEEALCDVASWFVLDRSAKRWVNNPPYWNWAPYATSIESYLRSYTDRVQQNLPPDIPTWYGAHRDSLRVNPTLLEADLHRGFNEIVAFQLFPIFLSDPSKWGAIRFLNLHGKQAKPSFESYLTDWLQDTPDQYQRVIYEIAGIFNLTIPV